MHDATSFHESPILNSPYEAPSRHWLLDEDRQPTETIGEGRRPVSFISPIPRPRKAGREQRQLGFDVASDALETEDQQYELTIWLTEVAPAIGNRGRGYLEQLNTASENANPELSRLALKLATGAGKTAVMAMLIAWQTVNAVRRPASPRFTRGFLVVAPGITIRDRLRVLQPNDPDSYYASRELVPPDMLREIDKAKIVITNYHAFQPRETMDLAKVSRGLLQGRNGKLATRETEGQMLARVMPELMTTKGVLVLNDEAHHCYREKPQDENWASDA